MTTVIAGCCFGLGRSAPAVTPAQAGVQYPIHLIWMGGQGQFGSRDAGRVHLIQMDGALDGAWRRMPAFAGMTLTMIFWRKRSV